MSEFIHRVFGCAVVKAVNANYNADFTHQPRTLPDGVVYATDKAFKYSIRHYLKDQYPKENIFFYKRLNEEMVPLSLAETYEKVLNGSLDSKKVEVIKNLLGCLDIRYFGATFAATKGKGQNKTTVNLSIHGPVQINHGMNRFGSNEIYSEQIMSPFRNPTTKEKEGDTEKAEKGMTTLGQQSKLREGHYVHHFSINPQNLEEVKKLGGNAPGLTEEDIEKLKEAMCCGVSYYDSAAKAGTDNELLLWVQLKKDSKTVLPVFTEMVTVSRENGKTVIDFGGLGGILGKVNDQIEKIEIYYLPENTLVKNLPTQTKTMNLLTRK